MSAFRLRGEAKPPQEDLSTSIGSPGNPYPASVTLPRKPDTEAPFSSNDQLPYRGAEPHGVALKSDKSAGNTNVHLQGVMEPFTPGEEEKASVVPEPSTADWEQGAVPVRIVTTAPPISMRKRFSTQTLPITPGNPPQRVLTFRPNRINATIYLKGLVVGGTADRVWFGNDEGVGFMNGCPLDAGDVLNIGTTDDIFVSLDVAAVTGALVCIVSEFEVEAVTKQEQGTGNSHKVKHHG